MSNPQRYQVVEAQPKVAEAMKHAGRMPKAVHRSIHLNEFGRTFCETCLPVGELRVIAEAAPGRTAQSPNDSGQFRPQWSVVTDRCVRTDH